MPWIKHFTTAVVTRIFSAHGIYVVEDYGDGQIMWGTEPPGEAPYGGSFFPAGEYLPGKIDVFTIRRVIEQLGKADVRDAIEAELEPLLNEGL